MFMLKRSDRSGAGRRAVILAACLQVFAAGGVQAEDEGNFTVRGFGTLGAVRTTTDDVEFVRDLSQARGATDEWTAKTDSVLGLQADWQATPQWLVAVQAISRYDQHRSFKPQLAWAFVKYDPTPNLSLRAGRLGTEFFMMADSRWVGYSFLTVRPPGDYFWYLPFYSIHGGDVALTLPLGEGIVRGKAFYGLSRGSIPLGDEQWNIRNSPMAGGYLEYQSGHWQVRGSYANIRFEHDLPVATVMAKKGLTLSAADADYLRARGTRTHYYSFGVVYDRGPVQAQLMLNHIEQGSHALESSDAAYFLFGYRLADWTPYLGYSTVRSHRRGRSASAVVNYVMEDSHSDQDTVFAGVRWDFARNVALKAQWDGVRGSAASLFPYRRDDRANWDGRMSVFSMSLDFVF